MVGKGTSGVGGPGEAEAGARLVLPPLTMGFIARAGLALLGVWALGNVVWLGRELLFVAFFAALFAAFLSIFVDRLEDFGAPRSVAAITVLVLAVVVSTGIWALTWPTLQEQIAVLQRQLPQATAEIVTWLMRQYRATVGGLVDGEPELWSELRARLGSELASILAGALPLLNSVIGVVAGVLIVVFAGLYLAIEPDVYLRGIVRLLPPASRDRTSAALRDVGHSLRRWMLGTVINMIAIGVMTTLGLWILGVPASIGLGFIAALLEFVPIFGPIIATLPAALLALIVSPTLALYVVILYVVVQQIESNVLTPLVMKGTVKLPPALTVLFQALMAVLFGFMGLLLAVPVLAALMVLVQRLYVEPLEGHATVEPVGERDLRWRPAFGRRRRARGGP